MWQIVVAEWRKGLNVQAMTLLLGVAVLAVTIVVETGYLASAGQRFGARETRILFVWMYLCTAPLLTVWYWNLSSNPNSTFRVVDTLPLSNARLNFARLLSLLIQLAPVLIVWVLHAHLFRHLNRPITPWFFAGVGSFVLFAAVGVLCHRLFWVGTWATIVVTILVSGLDRWETRLSPPATTAAVATAAVFAVLAAGLGMWIGLGRAPRHRSFD